MADGLRVYAHPRYATAAALSLTTALALHNHFAVYRVLPYLLLGVALWAALLGAGLHATLAGVLLALCIPTREPRM